MEHDPVQSISSVATYSTVHDDGVLLSPTTVTETFYNTAFVHAIGFWIRCCCVGRGALGFRKERDSKTCREHGKGRTAGLAFYGYVPVPVRIVYWFSLSAQFES